MAITALPAPQHLYPDSAWFDLIAEFHLPMLRVPNILMLQVFLNVHNSLKSSNNILKVKLVKHVHWLHSRALKDRWHKELILVTHEMQWMVHYFLHKAKNWQLATDSQLISSGGKSYAHQQTVLLMKLAHIADTLFRQTPSQYSSPFVNNIT